MEKGSSEENEELRKLTLDIFKAIDRIHSMAFYLKGSDQEYFSKFWMQERAYLSKVDAKLLPVNEANLHSFGDLITKGCTGVIGNDAIKPRLVESYQYFCIPYELGEKIERELVPETIISQFINDNLDDSIFIASTDASFGCFSKCCYINEEIIWNFASSHLNTPFLIFDDKKEVFALIDYDLPLQIIGYKNNILDSGNYIDDGILQTGWNTVFDRYSNYMNMPHIFREYYKFLLPAQVTKILNSMTIFPLIDSNQK